MSGQTAPAPLRTTFQNADVAKSFEYNGNWIANGKEKRIAWPSVYDGLFCEITPQVAEKLLASSYPGLTRKLEKAVSAAKGDK